MLSRLAESFFWLGRYLERAEGTTRLLNEFHQLVVQDSKSHAAHGCGIFSQRFGVEIARPNAPELIRAVYGAAGTPNTILGSLNSARSNARAVRDALPSDFYESINKLYASTSAIDLDSPGQALRMILERLAVTHGTYEWLAPLDESAHFFRLGRSLERVDLICRLLALDMESEWPEQGPSTSLRAVGGLSTFLRAKVPITPLLVRLFLISDLTFPRSLLLSAIESEAAIKEIAQITQLKSDQVLKPMALIKSRLTYLTADAREISDVIAEAMSAVDKTTLEIRDTYFRPVGSIVWSN